MYCHVIQLLICILCCLSMTACLNTCRLPYEPPEIPYKNAELSDKQEQEKAGASDKQEQEKSSENNKSEK